MIGGEKYSYYTQGNGVVLTSFGAGRKEKGLRIEGNFYTPAFFAFFYGLATAPEYAPSLTLLSTFAYSSLDGKVSFDFLSSSRHDLDVGVSGDISLSPGFAFFSLSLGPFLRYSFFWNDTGGIFIETYCPVVMTAHSYSSEGSHSSLHTFPGMDMILGNMILKSRLGFAARY